MLDAAAAFPTETGLGWDKMHPRILRRLSRETVKLMVTILHICEQHGTWPNQVAFVLIALLPKGDGDFRPIGLLSFLPRIWMRARRSAASKWEASQGRGYLYAGKGKGTNVAAWRQGAVAELADALGITVQYAQALLGLVKAFNKVPHWLLVRDARALGFPLKLLRLSLAAYLVQRVVRINQVVSTQVQAICGVAAGSGFAATEMRLVFIRIIDKALIYRASLSYAKTVRR